MKAEFMQLWDGILSGSKADKNGFGVVVIGATNRPRDIDPAILRRLSRSFQIRMPGVAQRKQILQILLKDE